MMSEHAVMNYKPQHREASALSGLCGEPEPHRDWSRQRNCSQRSCEWQTGIACLRQKHGASCQPRSLRGIENFLFLNLARHQVPATASSLDHIRSMGAPAGGGELSARQQHLLLTHTPELEARAVFMGRLEVREARQNQKQA
ncbi:hypothetical protein EYF80_017913 [Liparis tanakae]|uniref:Uncharacterized protein n=1 Tax=Liparis tanakae TaxID=230148 RepID=A0A4Z2I1H1_9TELE|nr:hypothetical protein EYF80_017913 [Liparis tanakae]